MRDNKIGYNLKPHESPYKKIRQSFDAPASPGEVAAFAADFCKYTGARFAYPVASYAEALLAAFYALNIGHGSEVATSAYNFPDAAGALEMLGARPVFVDIDIPSYNMNMSHFELMVTNGLRAVIATHMFGTPCQMDAIMEAASIYKLFVIEEVGGSLGGVFKGVKCGCWGHISIFNLDSSSILDCGTGAVVATSNEKVNARLRAITSGGLDQSGELRVPAPAMGMSPEVARIARERLKYIDDLIEYKYMVSKYFRRELMYHTDIVLPDQNPYALNTFNYFPAFFKKADMQSKMARILAKRQLPQRRRPAVLTQAAYYRNNYPISQDAYKNSSLAGSCAVLLPNDFSTPFEAVEETIREMKNL